MVNQDLEAVLAREAAALPIREEIARLAVGTKPKVAAMLVYISAHLFDPKLSVSRIRKACHLRDNSIALQFHDQLGSPPARMIASWRQAVAAKLLAESELPVWKIANLLGFSSIQVFSRSFFRIFGTRPRDYRRRPVSKEVDFSASISTAARHPDLLERLLAGDAADHEAAEVISRLLEKYPPSRRRQPASCASGSPLADASLPQAG